jgi:amino acid adenylation domain-containing protein
MRVEARLRETARTFGAKTAVIASEGQLSYAELDARSDGLASSFVALGVKPGDRLLMVLDNGCAAVISFFGAWKAGAVPCPLHPTIKAEKLATILDSITASVIVTQPRMRGTVEAAIALSATQPSLMLTEALDGDLRGALSFETASQPLPEGVRVAPQPQNGDRLALLIHTSGSTGRPKGVMLSHGNVLVACASIVSYLGNTADDTILSVLPLSFGYGITQMVTMTMTGGTLVLEKSFAFPRKILARLAETKATGFPLVPTMAALITGMKDLTPGLLPDLRYITSAAAAMPPAMSVRLQQIFPQARLYLMYGQTECLRATYLAPEEALQRPGSVGKAIPGMQAFVVDEDGRRAPPGVTGELMVEGAHVMQGYWQDPLATARTLAPTASGRRLQTGDLFRADSDGFLYFVSRRDDIIKTRGEKVSPQEVENILYALPGIREAAVAGIDDPVFGQVVRAFVVLAEGAVLSERDIIRHCALQLEDYMVPKSVEFRDCLPRTATGKIRLGAEEIAQTNQGNAA